MCVCVYSYVLSSSCGRHSAGEEASLGRGDCGSCGTPRPTRRRRLQIKSKQESRGEGIHPTRAVAWFGGGGKTIEEDSKKSQAFQQELKKD